MFKSGGVKLDLWAQTIPQISTKQTIIYNCNLLNRKNATTYDVGKSGLGQLDKCGGVKQINFIKITIHKIKLHIFQTVIMLFSTQISEYAYSHHENYGWRSTFTKFEPNGKVEYLRYDAT